MLITSRPLFFDVFFCLIKYIAGYLNHGQANSLQFVLLIIQKMHKACKPRSGHYSSICIFAYLNNALGTLITARPLFLKLCF